MSLESIFDKCRMMDSMFADATEKRKIIDCVEMDSIQDSIVEDMTAEDEQRIKDKLHNPQILPCGFDITIEAWLGRISLWGTLKCKYTDPDNRTRNISIGEFEDAMTESDEMTRVLGKWTMERQKVNAFTATREFYSPAGKRQREKYFVEIELDKDLKKAFR